MESRVERTTNKHRDWWVNFFRRSDASLSIDATGTHLRVTRNGRGICLGDPDDPRSHGQIKFVTELTLTRPGEKFWSSDHHGSAVFTVERITPEFVVLGYRSSFDSTSFGQNVLSIDEGEITLEPFQNPLNDKAN